MFQNARTYNQEGSWVYVDADEMEKVFDATFERVTTGSGLPGASGAMSSSYESALTPMDDDEPPVPPSRSRSAGRKQVISEDEYLTQSDD
jgi:ATP-dependent helicase STH1/SNF2